MRTLALIFFALITGALLAQTPVNKTYPVTAGQKISFRFDYPEVVKITTWDKNEIAIVGSVSINSGESDDAFELLQSTSGNTIYIENIVRDSKSLPKRITIMRGDEKVVFNSEELGL